MSKRGMKRALGPYVDEDEDLETALRNSLLDQPVKESEFDYPDSEYNKDQRIKNATPHTDAEEDAFFKAALRNSMKEESNNTELQQTIEKSVNFKREEESREAALDAFYNEMRKDTEKKHRASVIKKNEEYNMNYTSLLFVDLILPRIMKYTTICAIRSMCCVSKNLKKLVKQVAKTYPLKSVLVETVEDFILAHNDRRCLGSLYDETASRYHMIRFRIPRILPEDYNEDRRKRLSFVWPAHVKRLVVSVMHNYQLNWLLRNFGLFNFFHRDHLVAGWMPDIIEFYHHKEAFSDSRKALTYSYYDAEHELPLSTIHDPFSSLFDDLPNFYADIEKEKDESVIK